MLALPVAEFLALLHGTSYSGSSACASGAKVHPFSLKAWQQRLADALTRCEPTAARVPDARALPAHLLSEPAHRPAATLAV